MRSFCQQQKHNFAFDQTSTENVNLEKKKSDAHVQLRHVDVEHTVESGRPSVFAHTLQRDLTRTLTSKHEIHTGYSTNEQPH